MLQLLIVVGFLAAIVTNLLFGCSKWKSDETSSYFHKRGPMARRAENMPMPKHIEKRQIEGTERLSVYGSVDVDDTRQPKSYSEKRVVDVKKPIPAALDAQVQKKKEAPQKLNSNKKPGNGTTDPPAPPTVSQNLKPTQEDEHVQLVTAEKNATLDQTQEQETNREARLVTAEEETAPAAKPRRRTKEAATCATQKTEEQAN
ncbi:hypothetical protein M3Y98_00792800 [Aphelenchoides besseyi]|nr:hypothetical protein M3Y98_00792800 [Aphelenchoides besseyi]KAI6211949.1 hypothetical protein M3Y96_00488500 [Aphelenchoides besseyi]